MATQRHLDQRREPAQPVLPVMRYQKRRLGQVVFGSDRMQQRRVGKRVQHDDGGRIAAKQPVCKGIDLIDG